MSNQLFGKTYQYLGKALDVSARRHNLISGNIANMDTVGYKPSDIDFEKTLKKAVSAEKSGGELTRTNVRHIDPTSPFSVSDSVTLSESVDRFHLDSVDIDTEMTHLLENNLKYRTATEMLMRKMNSLKSAIDEGAK